ncbi:hypothetical protein PCANC_06985 [Puccinia coronata f. sp. avenae]|uniref:Uncharacterized protein n=1 Tax=Puccinia coronata f. sp. avenae TaxID=200324 RepID=A0A2N5UZT8_9BASI|nr:hypothetical protein PCANC_06985 [Puccinia coronata f. sp. avenae]
MRPSNSNSGAGPPNESLTDSNSVALTFGHQVWVERLSLPGKLAWMAASEFLSNAAIQFELGRAPPSESLTDSNSAARAFGHQV